jgi:hypothetical protein
MSIICRSAAMQNHAAAAAAASGAGDFMQRICSKPNKKESVKACSRQQETCCARREASSSSTKRGALRYGLYCPQDRAGTDVQTHRNATKAPLTGNRSTKPPPAALLTPHGNRVRARTCCLNASRVQPLAPGQLSQSPPTQSSARCVPPPLRTWPTKALQPQIPSDNTPVATSQTGRVHAEHAQSPRPQPCCTPTKGDDSSAVRRGMAPPIAIVACPQRSCQSCTPPPQQLPARRPMARTSVQ